MSKIIIILLWISPKIASGQSEIPRASLNQPEPISQLIIWNVGQGSWATEVDADTCIHYDMGGEKSPHSKILKSCQQKSNILALSHLDWDHRSFLRQNQKSFSHFCWFALPDDPRWSRLRTQFVNFRLCENSDATLKIHRSWDAPKSRDPNSSSDVFFSLNFKSLFPGDLPKKYELRIDPRDRARTRILILGHHGSQTSTSEKFLKSLPRLKMAIVSAREQKYHHPHPKTKALLRALSIPLLRTEDWGHIHFLGPLRIRSCKAYTPCEDP